jgi:hypothetical protein
MVQFTLEWAWPSPEPVLNSVECGGLDELKAGLLTLHWQAHSRKIAISATILTRTNEAFSIVVGRDIGSLLTYDGQNGNPPYFVSVGDKRKDLSLIQFYFGGSLSELPESHVIPLDVAIDGLLECVESGTLSKKIEWYGG